MNPSTDKAINDLLADPVLRAALHHRTAFGSAVDVLNGHGLDSGLLQYWHLLGRAAIDLHFAHRCIGAFGCDSPGKASLVTRALKPQVYASLAGHLQQHFVFGPNQPESETTSEVLHYQLVEQFAGAVAYRLGRQGLFKKLLAPITDNIKSVKIAKDHKTLLQEVMQSQRKALPKYQVQNIEGQAHQQVFKVRVTSMDGKQAFGEGASKKAAETAAAYSFIKKYLPSTETHQAIHFRPQVDVDAAADTIPALPNALAVREQFKGQCDAEPAMRLLTLSWLHRSRGLAKPTALGRDNTMLAFLGSYVFKWSVFDHCLRHMPATSILEAGGLHHLADAVFSYPIVLKAASQLFSEPLVLVKDQETLEVESVKKDMIQAAIGAFYLFRESFIHNGRDAVEGIQALETLWDRVGDNHLHRDRILPSKTLLQEKLHPFRLGIQYATREERHGSMVQVQPAFRLESPYLDDTLFIKGRSTTSVVHERDKNVVLESQLAERFIPLYEYVMGLDDGILEEGNDADTRLMGNWLFEHVLGLVKDEAFLAGHGRIEKICKGLPLGLKSLSHKDLPAFMSWCRRAFKFSQNLSRHAGDIGSFYGKAGYRLVRTEYQNVIASGMDQLRRRLEKFDPLGEEVLSRDLPEFVNLTDLATAARLRSSLPVAVSSAEFIDQVKLLYRTRISISASTSSGEASLVELQGSLLAMVGMLLNAFSAKSAMPSFTLVLPESAGFATLVVNKMGAMNTDLHRQLESRLLWQVLTADGGIVCREENESQWFISIPCVSQADMELKTTMTWWWAYITGGGLGAATDRLVASVLHDIKNEVLACMTASSQAKSKHRHSDRYAVAATASRHVEQALVHIETVNKLILSTQVKTIESVNVATMFRSLVTEMLAWLPTSIHLTVPAVEPGVMVETDEESVRAMIQNLVRNSSEALAAQGGGRIEIECLFGSVAKQLGIEVCDSGPGFMPEQLNALNRGDPVSTSKSQGSGIGLLTVLILARGLGGTVQFSNREKGGSRVLICLPTDNTVEEVKIAPSQLHLQDREVNFT